MTNADMAADAAELATGENDRSSTPTTPKKQQPTPYDELLCTICGLKACWQVPANAESTKP
jgi:hypothetical protein